MDVDYIRPCKTHEIRDNFADHVKRGSLLPGLDYACATGDKVWATAIGMVVACSNNPLQVFGKHVVMRHSDGRMSYYLHLSAVEVSNGQRVKGGHVLGRSGNTGKSTGPHLHFSIKDRAGQCVNPLPLLRRNLADKIDIVVDRPNGKAPAKKQAVVAEVIPE